VEVILNMRQKMQRMETEVNELLEYLKREFFRGDEDAFESRRRSLVLLSQMKIVKRDETTK
jgi:hypothetical protein